MKVYVLVSHQGLNSPWIQGVCIEPPTPEFVEAVRLEAARGTGHQETYVEEHELDGWVSD